MAEGFSPRYVAILHLVNDNFPPLDEEEPGESPLADISACVVYTRLSRQDDKSHSPQTQLHICRDCARRQKWKVLKEFTQDADQPISGKAFEARPGWDALSAFLKSLPEAQRRKTCVLVKSFDRFSRNLEEGLATERIFRTDLAVRLRAAEMLYVAPETEEGWMTFVDMLKFAHYERIVIVKRTKQGLGTARREGVHLGQFPRHFEKDKDGRIVPSKEATEVAEMRAQGRPYTEIAAKTGVTRQEAFSICKFLRNQATKFADDI